MMVSRFLSLAAAAAIGFATHGLTGPLAAAQDKGPPACAKILFRPLPAGQNDGEQEAGIYTSRYSHLELKGMVKGGEAQDYYLTARNKKLGALAAVPAAAANCAKDKKMPAPTKASASCTGDRLAAVIAHSGKDKVALLYALRGKDWQFCGAGALGVEG
jgi:hypothetical protein